MYVRFYHIDAESDHYNYNYCFLVSWCMLLWLSHLAVKDVSLETLAANVVVLDERIVHLQSPNLRPRLCFGEKWLRYADGALYETRSELPLRNGGVV